MIEKLDSSSNQTVDEASTRNIYHNMLLCLLDAAHAQYRTRVITTDLPRRWMFHSHEYGENPGDLREGLNFYILRSGNPPFPRKNTRLVEV